MNLQSAYPIFESGQILSSRHLNDVMNYLESGDRATRTRLVGIGVVCGLDVSFDDETDAILISEGVAITSEGHLISLPATTLTQRRVYTPPSPTVTVLPEVGTVEDPSQYAFFRRMNNQPIPLFELLAAEATIAPNSPRPVAVTANFVADKAIMLFLEVRVDSLKNCDLNDCSDRGMLADFNLRVLALSRGDAAAVLQRESTLTGNPVDRHNHPRFTLEQLRVPKLRIAANDIESFHDYFQRIVTILSEFSTGLLDALQESFNAYRYLLEDLYPPDEFPDGPFANRNFLALMGRSFGKNLFLVQYVYDVFLDIVDSHNEFLEHAARLDATCAPNSGRFPKHVLLGQVAVRPVAFPPPAGAAAGDVDTGYGAPLRPAPLRHHFITSPLYARQDELLDKVRSLHYRTYLIAYRARFDELMERPLRITPSKGDGALLSDRAVPFYYDFESGDDLHRNWAFDKATVNQLSEVLSHQFTDNAEHPLKDRRDADDFYRIEGVVGKTLSGALRDLVRQKKELGIDFAIEPVYIRSNERNDLLSTALDSQAQLRARQALFKLLSCKLEDLELVFTATMLTLFAYLMRIAVGLSKMRTKTVVNVPPFVAIFEIQDELPAAAAAAAATTAPAAGAAAPAAGAVGARPGLGVRGSSTGVVAATIPRSSLLSSAVGLRRASVLPSAVAGATAATTTTRTGAAAASGGTGAAGDRITMGSVDARILGGSPLLVSAVSDFASLDNAARFAGDRERSSVVFRELQGTSFAKGDFVNRLGEDDTVGNKGLINAYKTILGGNRDINLLDRVKDFVRVTDFGDSGTNKDKVDNLFPSMNLLDKTEDLVELVRSPNLSEFDFDKFEARYEAFVDAYDGYVKWADRVDNRKDQELSDAQTEVLSSYSQIASAGVRTAIQSLADEFESRIDERYQQLILDGYANKHPGLEHKCGVGKGQTLVLAYAHKSILGRNMNDRRESIRSAAARPFSVAGITPANLGFVNPIDIFLPRGPEPDPLDDFVVVADFCVPYHCCDADCSETDIGPPVTTIPGPRTIRGTVFGPKGQQAVIGVLAAAKVDVININTNRVIAVDIENGKYAFRATPGATYEVQVKNATYKTARRHLTVGEEDEFFDVDFTLRKK